jgi:hypothetical protein
MNRNKISLQINLSATDLNICRKLLERQINFWYDELDEVVLSIESQKSYGRFAIDFDANKAALMALIHELIGKYPKTKYHFIDYSAERSRKLSELFFGGAPIPHKDYRGGPFYCYFDGLAECRNQYIIHLDSDMILGGKPNSWLQDAVDLLNSDPGYLFINPLAGPPTNDFHIKQEYLRRLGNYRFLFQKMSTRVFLADRNKFFGNTIQLRKVSQSPKNIKWFFRNKMRRGYELPEILISEMMQRNGLLRVDTFGEENNGACFTLHPVVKPAAFIEGLPALLKRIDSNDIPDSQRGYYNVNNDFFDFESVK